MAQILARLPARPDPFIYQCSFCSDVKRKEVSGCKCLIHPRQKPLIRAQILPFEFAEPFIDDRFPTKLDSLDDVPEPFRRALRDNIPLHPLLRLSDFHISHHGRFGVLALQVHATHGGETLEFVFPAYREKAMSKTIQRALADKL